MLQFSLNNPKKAITLDLGGFRWPLNQDFDPGKGSE
jgi:hypothetical protein